MPDGTMNLGRLLAAPVETGTLLDHLHSVIDPELGVNIVDLGLVYDAAVVDGVAQILITMTTPACPLGDYLTEHIRWALLEIDAVLDVKVEITHDPRWSPDMMTAFAKSQLGWAR